MLWRKNPGRRVNNWSMLDIRALAIQNAGLGVNSTEAFTQGFNRREIKMFPVISRCTVCVFISYISYMQPLESQITSVIDGWVNG